MGIDDSFIYVFMRVYRGIKRDVAWDCVEIVVDKSGFFSRDLEVLSEGRWPFTWDGSYPLGQFAVM